MTISVSAIMACDKNGGVAKNGTLPWPKNKEDLKIFKEFTLNRTVVMGRKTWDDPLFPSPLPSRKNVIITTNPFPVITGADICVSGNPVDIIEILNEDIIVIGGASIFKQFIPYISEISLSLFHDDYDCDTFIPHGDLFYNFDVTDKKIHDKFTHIRMVR